MNYYRVVDLIMQCESNLRFEFWMGDLHEPNKLAENIPDHVSNS